MNRTLPSRVISWYGDDFTGSTDALEVLAPHLRSVLFLRRPEERFFAQFAEYAAFGLAGTSRSETPEWMDAYLSANFEWLASLNSAICHYKICSTFDSSPMTGSIGRAIEIGKRVFDSRFVPLIVGAPALRRYTVFGNLFAAVDDVVYRIDRHPTMKCHPVTPMREADLRMHLRDQTRLQIGLLDALMVKTADVAERYCEIAGQSDAVLIDVMDGETLAAAGRLIWCVDGQPFVVGSSGVEYALIAYWGSDCLIRRTAPPVKVPSTDRIAVLSGSCSPITQKQIEYAGQHGFALVRLDVNGLVTGERCSAAANEACCAALDALAAGRSVVLFTAASLEHHVQSTDVRFRHNLSERAGQILNRVLDASGVTRVVVAGGDTSSHAGRQLGIDALTFQAHLAPGAPLCRTWSQTPERQGLEIVFKGGQCGNDDFFVSVRNGNN